MPYPVGAVVLEPGGAVPDPQGRSARCRPASALTMLTADPVFDQGEQVEGQRRVSNPRSVSTMCSAWSRSTTGSSSP